MDKESGHEKAVTSLSKSSDWSFITGMLNKSAKVIICLTILNMLVFYIAFTHFPVWNVYESGYISYVYESDYLKYIIYTSNLESIDVHCRHFFSFCSKVTFLFSEKEDFQLAYVITFASHS